MKGKGINVQEWIAIFSVMSHKAGRNHGMTLKLQALIFCTMTKALDLIEEHLEWRGWLFVRMDGSTSTEGRGAIVNSFNASDSPHFVFLLSTRTGGVGLNLQTADTAILYDSDWNPQMDLQAEARIHRIGQTRQANHSGSPPISLLPPELNLQNQTEVTIFILCTPPKAHPTPKQALGGSAPRVFGF
jgi:superfamily II DNA/RNA helicase